MKSVPVDDLPEELANLVVSFTEYLRNLPVTQKKDPAKNPKPEDFLEVDLGVKVPLTRKEIYEDV